MNPSDLTPNDSYLHKVFPAGSYPEDGKLLASQRLFKPRRDADTIALKFPIDWQSLDREADRNWRMQLQGFAMLHPVMNVFDHLDERGPSIDYVFDIIEDWWANHSDDPNDIVTTRIPEDYAWYDMSVGFRALTVAFFSERIRGHGVEVSEERMSLLTDFSVKHRIHLRNPDVFYPNNHGIFQMHGLMALARLSDDERTTSDMEYAASRIEELLDVQFDDAGVHLEHSPHYHIFALRMFERVQESRWYKNIASLQEKIDSARSVTKWLVDPRKRPACIGDSIPTEQAIEFPRDEGEDLIRSDFDESGYSVVRSPWHTQAEDATYLFMMGGYHSKVHKHRDCLSFEWYDHGRKIISDSGKYGYNNDQFRRYVLSSRAHNTVEIDGFDMLRMSPYGSSIEGAETRSDGVATVRGALRFRAFTHERALHLKPGSWLIVDDHLELARARSVTQWTHMALGSQLRSSRSHGLLFDLAGDEIVIASLTGQDPSISHGDELNLQGFVSEGDNHIEPAYAVGLNETGEKIRLTTVIAIGRQSELDARAFAAGVMGLATSSTDLAVSKSVLNELPHFEGYGIGRVHFSEAPSSHTIHTKAGEIRTVSVPCESSTLLVDLGSGTEREHFIRTELADLGLSYLSIADPTLNSGDISVGWYQGNGTPVIPIIANYITTMAKSMNSDPLVVLTGRGAGGFCAEILGSILQADRVVVDVTEPMKASVDLKNAMLRHSYPQWGQNAGVVFERYLQRRPNPQEPSSLEPELRKRITDATKDEP